MNLDHQVNPTKEQFKALFSLPQDQPLVMVNILKYKGVDGKEAYHRYMKNVGPFLEKAQGRVLWKGNTLHTLIGDQQDQPDVLLLVEYPDIPHFARMIQDPGYQEVAKDRTMGLTYGGLLVCETSL